jgi:hypothetical protein
MYTAESGTSSTVNSKAQYPGASSPDPGLQRGGSDDRTGSVLDEYLTTLRDIVVHRIRLTGSVHPAHRVFVAGAGDQVVISFVIWAN